MLSIFPAYNYKCTFVFYFFHALKFISSDAPALLFYAIPSIFSLVQNVPIILQIIQKGCCL